VSGNVELSGLSFEADTGNSAVAVCVNVSVG